jgi:bifunctional DNA-binding transcriptional regulator/antitoxin component of YhaV-PrlF toxin-antitoxin module
MRLTNKLQLTLPTQAAEAAGFGPGDVVRVEAAGRGRLVISRVDDPILEHAGMLTDIYPPNVLALLRAEWPD